MSKCYGLWKRLEEWLPRKRLMQQIWRLINQGLGMVKMLTPERGNYMEWDLIQMRDHPWEIDFGYWLGPIYTAGIEGRAFIRLSCQQAHNGCLFFMWIHRNKNEHIFLHSSRIFIAEQLFIKKEKKESLISSLPSPPRPFMETWVQMWIIHKPAWLWHHKYKS